MEYGLSSKMYFTLPDYRYRSFDCLRLIDSLQGFQCSACQNPAPLQQQQQQPLDPFSSSPPPHTPHTPLWTHRSSGNKSASGSEATDTVDVSDDSILPADISTSSEPLNLSLQRAALPANRRCGYNFRRHDSASDAEDSRLATEAARCMNLQIRSHSCCPEWDPSDRCGSGGRRTQSDSPYVASTEEDDSADVELQVQWIKQEATDSPHSNGN